MSDTPLLVHVVPFPLSNQLQVIAQCASLLGLENPTRKSQGFSSGGRHESKLDWIG